MLPILPACPAAQVVAEAVVQEEPLGDKTPLLAELQARVVLGVEWLVCWRAVSLCTLPAHSPSKRSCAWTAGDRARAAAQRDARRRRPAGCRARAR